QAQDVMAAVPDTFDLHLTRALVQGHGTHDLPEEGEATTAALLRNHERQVEQRRSVARENWEQHPDTGACIADLTRRLLVIQAAGRAVHPCQFLDMMLEVQPGRAVEFCEAVLHAPDSPLAVCFGRFLARVRTADVQS